MRKLLISIALLTIGFSSHVFANNAQMNITLAKISDQLQAIKPLIIEAQQEQAQNPRTKVHFNSWVDANGIKHAGLMDDIQTIQTAIIAAINKTTVDPRKIKPINNDFIGD